LVLIDLMNHILIKKSRDAFYSVIFFLLMRK